MLDAMDRARALHLAAECVRGAAALNADAVAAQNAEMKTCKRRMAADLWQSVDVPHRIYAKCLDRAEAELRRRVEFGLGYGPAASDVE